MYSFDFKTKLARLNPLLFVNDESRRLVHGEFFASSLCLRKGKRAKAMTAGEYAQLDTEARKFTQDYDKGLIPEFVCGVPLGFVPEYDMFEVETRYSKMLRETVIEKYKFVARGWRSILKHLAEKQIIDLNQARRVFNCSGLGSDEYDKLTFQQKIQWSAGLRFQGAK